MEYTASNKSISTPNSPQTAYGGVFTDGFVAKLSQCDIDNSIVQTGSTLTLNESSGLYQWLDCNDDFSLIPGETNRSFSPTKNGVYAAQITKNAYTTFAKCLNFQSVGLSIKASTSNIRVYPNPTHNSLYVEFDSSILIKKLTLLNSIGQVLMEHIITEDIRVLAGQRQMKNTQMQPDIINLTT